MLRFFTTLEQMGPTAALEQAQEFEQEISALELDDFSGTAENGPYRNDVLAQFRQAVSETLADLEKYQF